MTKAHFGVVLLSLIIFSALAGENEDLHMGERSKAAVDVLANEYSAGGGVLTLDPTQIQVLGNGASVSVHQVQDTGILVVDNHSVLSAGGTDIGYVVIEELVTGGTARHPALLQVSWTGEQTDCAGSNHCLIIDENLYPSGSSYDFGSFRPDQLVTISVTLRNDSTLPWSLTTLSLSNPDNFTFVSVVPVQVAPQSEVVVDVQAAAPAVGGDTATAVLRVNEQILNLTIGANLLYPKSCQLPPHYAGCGNQVCLYINHQLIGTDSQSLQYDFGPGIVASLRTAPVAIVNGMADNLSVFPHITPSTAGFTLTDLPFATIEPGCLMEGSISLQYPECFGSSNCPFHAQLHTVFGGVTPPSAALRAETIASDVRPARTAWLNHCRQITTSSGGRFCIFYDNDLGTMVSNSASPDIAPPLIFSERPVGDLGVRSVVFMRHPDAPNCSHNNCQVAIDPKFSEICPGYMEPGALPCDPANPKFPFDLEAPMNSAGHAEYRVLPPGHYFELPVSVAYQPGLVRRQISFGEDCGGAYPCGSHIFYLEQLGRSLPPEYSDCNGVCFYTTDAGELINSIELPVAELGEEQTIEFHLVNATGRNLELSPVGTSPGIILQTPVAPLSVPFYQAVRLTLRITVSENDGLFILREQEINNPVVQIPINTPFYRHSLLHRSNAASILLQYPSNFSGE